MIAANGVAARFLDAHGFPSLRRVVKSPERWDRIRGARGRVWATTLPAAADSMALAAFLARRKTADPRHLSGSVDQRSSACSARGEYVVDPPGAEPPGPLRARRARLRALDGAEPPLPGSRHAAAGQSGARRPSGAIRHRRARRDSRRSARSRRTRRTRSSVRSAKSAAAMIVQSRDRRDVRRDRHRRVEQGHVRARRISRRSKASSMGRIPALDVGDRAARAPVRRQHRSRVHRFPDRLDRQGDQPGSTINLGVQAGSSRRTV